jgi:chromosome segregation ATPase
MFGYWKREAAKWESRVKYVSEKRDDLQSEVDYRRTQANAHNTEITALQDDLRRTKADLDAVKLQFAAEQQDNERLKFALNTTRAERQTLTDQRNTAVRERNGWKDDYFIAVERFQAMRDANGKLKAASHKVAKERDEWRETAEQAADLCSRTFAACERFIRELAELKGTHNARTDRAEAGPEPGEAADQADARTGHVPGCSGPGCCPGCVNLPFVSQAEPDAGPFSGCPEGCSTACRRSIPCDRVVGGDFVRNGVWNGPEAD